MKLSTLFIASLCLMTLAFGQNATLDNLENALLRAKANYDQNASQANLAALQNAESAYQSYFQTLPKPDRGSSFLAVVSESEPNDTPATADGPLVIGTDSGTGDLTPAGDTDYWRIDGLNVGDILFVLVDSSGSSTGTDMEMNVYSNDGTTVLEFDDDSGDGLASCVIAPVTVAGSAYAHPNEFGNNGTIEPYTLWQYAAAPGTAVAEVEPNNAAIDATPITSAIMSGTLTDADFFSFGATAGDAIVVMIDNDLDGDADFVDCEITILDTDGTTTLANEAPFTVTGQNAAFGTAANTGTHFVQISDGGSGGTDTDYRFAIIVGGTPVPVELQSFSVE